MKKQSGGAVLYSAPTGPAIHQITEEEYQHWERKASRLVEIRRHLGVLGCPALATPASETRAHLEELFGRSGLEAIVCSGEQNRVLWTDDLVQAALAYQEYGAKSVCTENLLRYWVHEGVLDFRFYEEACAQLIGWRYTPTPMSVGILVAAARLSDWNANRLPVAEVLRVMGEGGFAPRAALVIAAQALPRLFREIDLAVTRRALLFAVLDALFRRENGEVLVNALRAALPRVFGPERAIWEEVEAGIVSWLAAQTAVRKAPTE